MKRIKFIEEEVFDIGYGRDFLVRKVTLMLYPEMLSDVWSCKYILVSRKNIPASVYPDYIEIPYCDMNSVAEQQILDYFRDNVKVPAMLACDRQEFEVDLYGEYGISQSFDIVVDDYFNNRNAINELKIAAMNMAYEGTVDNEDGKE